jgi:hypothetical protein
MATAVIMLRMTLRPRQCSEQAPSHAWQLMNVFRREVQVLTEWSDEHIGVCSDAMGGAGCCGVRPH